MAWSCSSEEPQEAQLHEVKEVICAMQGSGTAEDCNESKGHYSIQSGMGISAMGLWAQEHPVHQHGGTNG